MACRGIDANSEQVRVGLAWAFDRYVEDPRMFVLQRDAEAARVGLWSQADPIPPWEWRAAKREAHSAE